MHLSRPVVASSGQPQAYFIGNGLDNQSLTTFSSQQWYPDLGATHHVTDNSDYLLDGVNLPGSDELLLGNGQGLSIKPIGYTHFHSPHETHTPLTLHNLLLVLDITKKLISVSKFARDNKVFFEFHADKCLVKSQAHSKVLFQGAVGPDGLYTFGNLQPAHKSFNSSFNFVTCSSAASSTRMRPSLYSIWHNKVGHPHHEARRSILFICNIAIPHKPEFELCTSCSLGKVHKLPSLTSTSIYKTAFELLFADVWGPAPMNSTSRFKYLPTIFYAYY